MSEFADRRNLLRFGAAGAASLALPAWAAYPDKPMRIGHIYGELMNRTMGIRMTHVPYRGGAPMTTDLISGVIPVGIDVITAFVPFFKTGQIKPLAVTCSSRASRRHRERRPTSPPSPATRSMRWRRW